MVQLLLDTGADIQAKTNFGLTALMGAAGSGHKPIVELLLNSGADLTRKDQNSWTALIWASSEKHTEIVELIKQFRDQH
ncbi:ankyrin repeat domain-containing protein [Planktothrix agardhii 1033]|jgi:ankyrin repeat protein|nr:ankyrin repeat domain-containing protein [Planktothrix agardhii 1033]